ncbi:MAG: hypothetical protein EBU54_01260 [Mycobacteriaceae bacterium]|nr:hypothetical protein [Mycobacteriaceae bacterium]
MSQDDLNDIHRRLRAAEQDAAAARILAGAADRDVSEIRAEIRDFRQATTTSFNALRADFVDLRGDVGDLRQDVGDLRQDVGDLRQDVGDLRENIGGLQGDFSDLGRGFTEVRRKVDATAAGQQRVVTLIESLIDQQSR